MCRSTLSHLPPKSDIDVALRFFYGRRKRSTTRTLTFKLRVRRKKQEVNLLRAFTYVTQLTHRVLESLREDPALQRNDGAFALLAELLRKRADNDSTDNGGQNMGNRATALGDMISKQFNAHHLRTDDYEFSSYVRAGVYREVAKMLLSWFASFTGLIPGMEGEGKEQVPSAKTLYDAWSAATAAYAAAGNTLFPFGKHRGKRLKTVGRRELRWRLERLPAEEVIRQTIQHLELLLGLRQPTTPDELEQARFAEHPWRHKTTHERAVRDHRINVRIVDVPGDRILLENLSTDEQERLYDELLSVQVNRQQFDEVRNAVEILIQKRPPRFPTVAYVAAYDDQTALHEAWQQYEIDLRWFHSIFPIQPKKPLDDYSLTELEELESDATTRLLQSESALGIPRFQPLAFKRTMRPGSYIGFGLLYDCTIAEYVLALKLSGRKGDQAESTNLVGAELPFQGIKQISSRIGDNLEFFSFTETFQPPEGASLMLFSLAGSEFQKQYLQPLYKKASRYKDSDNADHLETVVVEVPSDADIVEAPSDNANNANHSETIVEDTSSTAAPTKKPRKKTPRAPIASAHVTCRWAGDGKPEFYLHIPVPVYEQEPPPFPETILGIHEHQHGFSYAVLDFSGSVIETGDLAIDATVLPRIGERTCNPNYADEVAVAILESAKKHNAYIGIEETGYQREVGVSRARNRRLFSRPSKRIATIVTYKALEYGLLPPRMVWGVAPGRDCGRCGARRPENSSGIRRVLYVTCPVCEINQPYRDDVEFIQECGQCGVNWRAHEARIENEFVCTNCHDQPVAARTNTAIVVALKTITGAVEYYEWCKKQTDTHMPIHQ